MAKTCRKFKDGAGLTGRRPAAAIDGRQSTASRSRGQWPATSSPLMPDRRVSSSPCGRQGCVVDRLAQLDRLAVVLARHRPRQLPLHPENLRWGRLETTVVSTCAPADG